MSTLPSERTYVVIDDARANRHRVVRADSLLPVLWPAVVWRGIGYAAALAEAKRLAAAWREACGRSAPSGRTAPTVRTP